MNNKNVPLFCPECKRTGVVEITDQVVTNHFYKWDEEKQGYALEYEDSDNYGDLYIECANRECQHRFSDEEYQQFSQLISYTK